MPLRCEASASTVLKQLEMACFHSIILSASFSGGCMNVAAWRARWSEDGPMKNDGLRPPSGQWARAELASNLEEHLPHLPLLSDFLKQDVTGGGQAAALLKLQP